MIGPIIHDPQQLREGLLGCPGLIFIDTETSGKHRSDKVLSIGLRFGGVNYILFTAWCCQASILPYVCSDEQIRWALEPLPGITTVYHHVKFDLPRLREYGVSYGGPMRDTLQLMRLLDQDRGFSSEKDAGRHRARVDLVAPGGRRYMNYKLKHLASQLCNIRPVYTPDKAMQLVPYTTHARYLAHDLLCTERLHNWVWPRLPLSLKLWWEQVGVPLTYELCKLTDVGIAADRQFIDSEAERIGAVMAAVSEAHAAQHGVALADLLDWKLRKLIYKDYGLPCHYKKGNLPIDHETLEKLLPAAPPEIRNSLELIIGHRQLNSLQTRLHGNLKHIEPDGRIHASFDNRQSCGRISATAPNLQAISKRKTILAGTPYETTIKPRDMLVASPGCVLVAADTSQSDPRCLAHCIASETRTTEQVVRQLLRCRAMTLDLEQFRPALEACRNPNFVDGDESPPPFNPNGHHQLVEDFQHPQGDLYVQMAQNVLHETIAENDPRRKIVKTVFLAQLNGQSARGLSKRLNCSVEQAKQYVAQFFAVYHDVLTYLGLLRSQVAITGQTTTWGGRTRTITAHRWMVMEPRVRILLTYADGHKFWFDVSPIRPSLRVLTTFVHRIWSVQDREHPKLIYTATNGRIGTRYYPHVDEVGLQFCLPIRNLPWRSIRRIQKLDAQAMPIEMAAYEGFDLTARQAISAVMQGGTADLTVSMMLRSRPVFQQFGARLLLQVHDELVCEIPEENQEAFMHAWREVLETPPQGFLVPVRVDMASGLRYSDCK